MQSLKVRGPCGSLDFQTLLVLGPLQKLLLLFIFHGSVPLYLRNGRSDSPPGILTLMIYQKLEVLKDIPTKEAKAYVCRNYACSQPVDNPEALIKLILEE